jgi:type VI secretion system FHA domain protein
MPRQSLPALTLQIDGPGYSGAVQVQVGAPEQVLGRDPVCQVCLPDPGKTISRKHLAVWNAQGLLTFRVLSVVNGVDLPGGEIPPGAQAVLPPGQRLLLGDYTLLLVSPPSLPVDDDPWSVFDEAEADNPHLATSKVASVALPVLAARAQPAQSLADFMAEDDPFSDSVFAPDSASYRNLAKALQSALPLPNAPKPPAKAAMTGDIKAFYLGLGLDTANLGKLSAGELEAAGRLVRRCFEGLQSLHAAQAELRQELKTDERTMVATQDTNPLNADWPLEAKLQYLLAGRAWSVGFMPPEAALEASLAALHTHDEAAKVAARAVVEGTLREFEPESLKQRLLEGRASLGFLDSARLWDIYTQHYAGKSRVLGVWLQQLTERYFPANYLRETQRLQRESGKGKKFNPNKRG